jgi:hypothetical protein
MIEFIQQLVNIHLMINVQNELDNEWILVLKQKLNNLELDHYDH